MLPQRELLSSGPERDPTLMVMQHADHVERDQRDVELVESVLDALRVHEPTLRMEIVEAARARLVKGTRPTSLDLAGTVVAEFA